MKTIITILLIFTIHIQVNAQTLVGTGFNYQAELLDNGSPANGDYDIIINAFPSITGGTQITTSIILSDIPVSRGLLAIEDIDLGFNSLGLGEEIWLELLIKKSSNTGGSFETLSPRQKISAVPYAVRSEISDTTEFAFTARTAENALDLSINNSNFNDALVFNGTSWRPKQQQWLEVGDEYSANNKKVTIGANSGTGRLTVFADGTEGYAFNVLADSGTPALFVHQNAGVSIGSRGTGAFGDLTPDNGLYVGGDVEQASNKNGIMKYMVRVNCKNFGSTIINAYPNTAQNPITITDGSVAGRCTVHFPNNINTRYWQVTPVATNGTTIANCHTLNANNQLICQRKDSGTPIDGNIMILVY